MRRAVIIPWRTTVTHHEADLETVRRYLPANYAAGYNMHNAIVIQGEDNAGWTLDDYVIPRLASGGWRAKEVTDPDVSVGLYGVVSVPAGTPDAYTCGECGRSWVEDITPAARCPWEYEHEEED